MATAMTKESTNNVIDEDNAWCYAMVLATGCALPMVLKTVIELHVLEIIKRAGSNAQLSPTEIVAHLPTKNPNNAATILDRMLQLLASYSVLTCSLRTLPGGGVERLYGLAPVCRFLTKDEDGNSLATEALLCHDKVSMESWYHAKDAILEGGNPFNWAYGKSIYEYLSIDSRFSNLFNQSMTDMSCMVMKKLLENYRGFEGISTLVDLAGNTGASLNMILSKYPNIKGINFDLPYVIDDAPEYPGVTHIGGDMFASVPKSDAIFIKNIFHNWDDGHCIKFMRNCYSALSDHGKVIACEVFLPTIPKATNAARMAYNWDAFMIISPNGKERTKAEFEALGIAAGFEGFRVACSVYDDFKVMEFLKKI